MKTRRDTKIMGNWVTVLLPVNDDDSIDFSRLNDEIDTLISVNPDGMYCNGTAGEFYNITETEFDRIAELVAQKCQASQVPFQIGVSHMSPFLSLERLKRSVALQPTAVQVILPDWFQPTNEEAIDFLNKMADTAGEIGLVLYNPPMAKLVLTPSELKHIQLNVPNLVGIKVADGDDKWYEDMKPLAERISVFIPGHKIATGYKKGVCHGAYSNMACLNPKAAQIWTDSIETDLDAALELEERIIKFIDTCISPYLSVHKYSNQAVDKMLAAIGSWADIGVRLRWPYKWVPEPEVENARPMAMKILPEFFIKL